MMANKTQTPETIAELDATNAFASRHRDHQLAVEASDDEHRRFRCSCGETLFVREVVWRLVPKKTMRQLKNTTPVADSMPAEAFPEVTDSDLPVSEPSAAQSPQKPKRKNDK